MFKACITGDDPGGNVIFEATLDPAVPGSASVVPVVGHPRRLDGIDFLPGSTTTVAVGAQIATGGGGSIEVFDVEPPTGVLTPLVADTNVPAPGLTQPSTATGILYGSNIVNGEIIFWDPSIPAGGFFISAAAIGAGGPDLMRLGTMAPDGIRVTDNGYLILTGLAGVIASVDIAGVLADGPDDGDVNILFDDAVVMAGVAFDDLTPLIEVPKVPSASKLGRVALALTSLGLGALALLRRRAMTGG